MCTSFALSLLLGLILAYSVRAGLRNADPHYNFTSNYFLRCLYEGEEGDPEDPEKGFLKGPLLVRVSKSIIFTQYT